MKFDFIGLQNKLRDIETAITSMQELNWITQQERVQLMYAKNKLQVFLEEMISENNGLEIIDTEVVDPKEIITN